MPPRVTLQPPRCAGKSFSSIHYLVDHTEQQHYGVQTYSRRHVQSCSMSFAPRDKILTLALHFTNHNSSYAGNFYSWRLLLRSWIQPAVRFSIKQCFLYLSATEKSAINVSCIFPCLPESKRGAIYCGLNLCFFVLHKKKWCLERYLVLSRGYKWMFRQ